MIRRSPQQTLGGSILAIAGTVWFHVHRQGQPAHAHDTEQNKVVKMPMHFSLRVFDGIA